MLAYVGLSPKLCEGDITLTFCTRLIKSCLQSVMLQDAVDKLHHMGPAWVSRAVCPLASGHRHERRLWCRGPPFILGGPQNEGGPE